jgi:Mrp family chromosome partitioning ATPase
MLGLLLGVIAAFVRDRVGDLPRDRDEIGLILGAPVLAADQQEGAVRRRLRQWRGERAEGSWTSHRLLGLVLERWIGQERGGPPAFMMASPVSGPDTALVAAEASRALAWAGRRVICISSAIGDDSLSGEFELSNDVGFSSVVAGDVSVAGSARRIGLSDLSVIPSGPPSPRSAEVLATRGLPVLGSVVDQLKDSSDVVVVAGPPLLGPNGGVAISTVVDFVIVVISAKTRREELHEVRWRLAEMGVEVLGAVVTRQMSKHRIRHLRHVQSTSTAPAVRVPRDTTPIEPRVRPNGRSGANQPLPDVALELRGSARGTGARNASSGRTTKFAGSTSTNPSRQSSGRSRRRHS